MHKWAIWLITHKLTWVLYLAWFFIQVPINIVLGLWEILCEIPETFNSLQELIKFQISEHLKKQEEE
jgi:hypothetical protein